MPKLSNGGWLLDDSTVENPLYVERVEKDCDTDKLKKGDVEVGEELEKSLELLPPSTPFRMEKARQKAEDPIAKRIQKLAQARLDAQREKVLALLARKMKKADDEDDPADNPGITDKDLYDALADSPLSDDFDDQVSSATNQGGELQAAQMGVGWREADPDVLDFIRERRSNLEEVMDESTAKEVKRAIEQGMKETDTEKDLIERLENLGIFGEARAQRIARTESHLAVMKGAHEAMKQNGVKQRQWLAGLDERTRPSHLELNGQIQDISLPFVTEDGVELAYPGDPDGPPEEVINCRCSELIIRDTGEDLGEELDFDWEDEKEDEDLDEKIRDAARSLPKGETANLDFSRIGSLGVKPIKGRGVDYDVDEGVMRIGSKAPKQQVQNALRQHLVSTEMTVADAAGFVNNLRAAKLPEPTGSGSERTLAVKALGYVVAGDRDGLEAFLGAKLGDDEWARYRAVGAHFWMSPGTPGKAPPKRKKRP